MATTSVAVGGNFFDLSLDALTAGTTQTQAGATALTTPFNRVTTVTTVGDGLRLPAAVAGASVTVINSGANACTVYGAGSDTVNDIAGTTGILQQTNSTAVYACAVAGKWHATGAGIGYFGGIPTFGFQDAVTAHSGSSQLFGTKLIASLCRVTTSAAQGDSVQLPQAKAGMEVTVINDSAFPIDVYALFGPGDTINGQATSYALSIGVQQTATFNCTSNTVWKCQPNASVKPGVALLSADGAIPAHVPHEYMITKGGSLAALTLAAPTATVDDGLTIIVTSSTAFAHKITATGLLVTGSANVNVATWAASAGGSLTLMAYQGKWYVQAQVAITFT